MQPDNWPLPFVEETALDEIAGTHLHNNTGAVNPKGPFMNCNGCLRTPSKRTVATVLCVGLMAVPVPFRAATLRQRGA